MSLLRHSALLFGGEEAINLTVADSVSASSIDERVLARNYYVDATLGDDADDGTIDNPWKTTAKVNASTFNPCDCIYFKRGETFKGSLTGPILPGLTIPSSGSGDNPITFGAYGTGDKPKIHTLIIMEGATWTDLTGNLWTTSLAGHDPPELYFNGTKGTKVGDAPNAANEWGWLADALYVYSVGNPGTTYTEPGIQIVYGIPVAINDKDYITVQDIEVGYTNFFANVYSYTGSHHVTINRVDSIYSLGDGIKITGDTNNTTISNCTVTGAILNGIEALESSTTAGNENYITGNTVYANGKDGIIVTGNYYIIQNNIVYENGIGLDAVSGLRIFDNADGSGSWGENNIIRYNKVYDNLGGDSDGHGIIIDHYCDNNKIYYNLVYGNYGVGIMVYKSLGAEVYNNVAYGNVQNASATVKAEYAIWDDVGVQRAAALVKNNIGYATSAGSVAINLEADILDNAITLTNNLWYIASGNWYTYGVDSGSTLATWNALSYVGTDLNADPLFVSAATGDFTLQGNSPCVNAGVDLGDEYDTDYLGKDQDDYGAGWEIGAYALTWISLTVADVSCPCISNAIALTQLHSVAVQDLACANTVDAVTVTQQHVLSINELSCASTSDEVSLTQQHSIALADSVSVSSINAVLLTGQHVLSLSDVVSTSTEDPVVLSAGVVPIDLILQNEVSSSTVDALALIQQHNLQVVRRCIRDRR